MSLGPSRSSSAPRQGRPSVCVACDLTQTAKNFSSASRSRRPYASSWWIHARSNASNASAYDAWSQYCGSTGIANRRRAQ